MPCGHKRFGKVRIWFVLASPFGQIQAKKKCLTLTKIVGVYCRIA